MVRLLQYVAQFVALLGVYDDIFLSIHHIVTNIILRISPSDYPSRILSVALSFVRPMPIRLSNFCFEQPKRIVADSMIAA